MVVRDHAWIVYIADRRLTIDVESTSKTHLDSSLKMSSPIEKVASIVQEKAIETEKGELIVDHHADLGLQYLAKHGRAEYSIEEETAVIWKIDLYLMPIVSSHPELTA